MDLLLDYYGIPKEIKDLIGEFNADHRLQFKPVLIEFMTKLSMSFQKGIVCDNLNCNTILACSECYEESIIVELNYYCSEECMHNDTFTQFYYNAMLA